MIVIVLRLRVLVVSTAARSVKEVNTAAVERSWREAFAAASPAQVRKIKLAKMVVHAPPPYISKCTARAAGLADRQSWGLTELSKSML